jgi:orotidine-5'-phosphate decarboxylase
MLPSHLNGVSGMLTFCREIVNATADLVCAYKPNVAFFERFGSEGWSALEKLISDIPEHIPVIADAKRGDVGHTSRAYAEGLFERLGASACTVSPYQGADAVAPLLDHPRGFGYLLCRTSNPGASAIQDLEVDGEPLYARVIRLFQPALQAGRAGLVIGAQERQAFKWAARLAPEASILVPGVGAQGGTLADVAESVSPTQARSVVVSISRAIIHASTGVDFAVIARQRAGEFRQDLEVALERALNRHDIASSG